MYATIRKLNTLSAILYRVIEQNDIFIMSVFHAESVWKLTQAYKAQLFIQVDRRVVTFYNGIEL